MNKHYWGLWALLLTALLLFVALSFKTDGFSVCGLEIKTASFVQRAKERLAPADTTVAAKKGKRRGDTVRVDSAWRAPMDTTAKTILFFGDSMLEGLAERFATYCHKNGHTLIEVIWYSSSTKCWAQSTRLSELINKYHPNYIFVCLGANELYVPDIKNVRKPYLKKILAEIGDTPYVWIGPPNWDKDTGINDLLAENLEEGCFYLSANDRFSRSRDGAHPTRASAHLWMDRVVKWVGDKSAHPIRLKYPGEGIRRADRIIIYQPPV